MLIMSITSSENPEEDIDTNIGAAWHHADLGDYNAALFCIGEAYSIAAQNDVREEIHENIEAADEKLTAMLEAL